MPFKFATKEHLIHPVVQNRGERKNSEIIDRLQYSNDKFGFPVPGESRNYNCCLPNLPDPNSNISKKKIQWQALFEL